MTNLVIIIVLLAVVGLLGLVIWFIKWVANQQAKALANAGVGSSRYLDVMTSPSPEPDKALQMADEHVATATPRRQVRLQKSEWAHPLICGRRRDRKGNFRRLVAA